jgi:hypothetical protein
MSISFPTSPTTGQQYTTPGGVTYTWTGSRWTAVLANLVTINSEINAANSAIVTANLSMKSYVNSQVNNLVSANIAGWNQLITHDNKIIAYADILNLAMISNVNAANSAITTALSNSEAYTQTYVSNAFGALSTTVTNNYNTLSSEFDSLNTEIGRIDANVAAANTAITTANTAVVSYISTLNQAMLANLVNVANSVVTANLAVVAYVNNQITHTLANLSNVGNTGNTLLSYVNSALATNANVINSAWQSNLSQVISEIVVQAGDIANVQSAITAANLAITTSNVALANFTINQVSVVANAIQASLISNIASVNANVLTSRADAINYANILVQTLSSNVYTFVASTANGLTTQIQSVSANLATNVATLQSEINLVNANVAALSLSGGTTYANANVAAYLPTYTGNINSSVPMTSGTHRYTWVSNVAPASNQGSVGDIWYQTF